MRALAVLLAAGVLSGCAATIYGLRIPLEDPQFSPTDAPNIVIDDVRPEAERKVHRGGGLACERWYGDDTYVPSKLAYLEHLLSERIPENVTTRVKLRRFDTIEHCDTQGRVAGGAAVAGATAGATGGPTIWNAKPVPGGDRVVVRIAGTINGVQFDSTRQFDYGDVWKSPHDSPQYLERMRLAVAEIADEIAAKIAARKRR